MKTSLFAGTYVVALSLSYLLWVVAEGAHLMLPLKFKTVKSPGSLTALLMVRLSPLEIHSLKAP